MAMPGGAQGRVRPTKDEPDGYDSERKQCRQREQQPNHSELTIMQIHIKRAYEKPSTSAGCWVLDNAIGPCGVSKKDATIDYWLKDIVPSAALREGFSYEVTKWRDFKRISRRELEAHPEAVGQLLQLARKGKVSLIFATRERAFNNAVALKDYLERSFP